MDERLSTWSTMSMDGIVSSSHVHALAPQAVGRRGSAMREARAPAAADRSASAEAYLAEREQRSRVAIKMGSSARPGSDNEFERAQRIASGEIDAQDLDWLKKGFAAFLAGLGTVPLERCLRLPRNDSSLRRACRNYWLRRAWEALEPQLSPWRRSEKLAACARDFESRQWPRWRAHDKPPITASELEVALFHAFQSYDRIPFTAMQLHNIASPANEQ